MVPRLDADPLLDALALPLPAGRVPVRATWSPRTRRRGKLDPEFELLDTGVFDDGVLADRGRLREGRARRRLHRRRGSATPGPTTATLHVLPTLWFRNTWSWGRRPRPCRRCTREDGRLVAEHHALGRARRCAGERRARAAVLRERDQRAAAVGRRRAARYPKDGINDHVVHGAATVNPAAARHEGRAPLPAHGRARRDGRDPRCGSRPGPGDLGAAHERDAGGRAGRGRRVLRRARAGRRARPSSDGHAPGVRRDAVVASSSTTTTSSGGWTATRPSPPPPASRETGRNRDVAPPQQLRRHLDARHLGVPVVRGLGPGLPLRRAGPRRPGVRQGAADPALPRVVHAPERPAARVRVGVRRREPAGARLGRAARLRDRRLAGLRLPRARLPQADAELHLVGQPQGRRGQQRLRGRLPGPRQHRPVRPLGDRCRCTARSSSPTARPGWRCTA